MRVQITKRTDSGSVLKLIRDDGTECWQKQHGSNAAFFPLHDLTHYSVETELGIRNGFYGLVAQGWSIEDTTGKGTRGATPAEAIFVEHVVGTLDSERAALSRWTADEFNQTIATAFEAAGRPQPRQLTDDDLARIRKRRAELFSRWDALQPGTTLDLSFPG